MADGVPAVEDPGVLSPPPEGPQGQQEGVLEARAPRSGPPVLDAPLEGAVAAILGVAQNSHTTLLLGGFRRRCGYVCGGTERTALLIGGFRRRYGYVCGGTEHVAQSRDE